METAAQLCNLALGRIGHGEFIDALDEPTREARACTVAYANACDVVLESYWWTWATRRVLLAQVADVTRSGAAYVYALPSDLATARYLHVEENVGVLETVAGREPFRIEDADEGAVLLTNRSKAELVYTRKVANLALWSALARDALAYRMAGELALSVAVKPQLLPVLETQYEKALARAKAADANQSQRSVAAGSEFIRARS